MACSCSTMRTAEPPETTQEDRHTVDLVSRRDTLHDTIRISEEYHHDTTTNTTRHYTTIIRERTSAAAAAREKKDTIIVREQSPKSSEETNKHYTLADILVISLCSSIISILVVRLVKKAR